MEFVAISKSVRISPRKIRLVVDSLGKSISANEAISKLLLVRKRPAIVLGKTIKSAIANAVHNGKAKTESLILKKLEVTDGTPLKRFRPSTRGRVHPYKKKSSHIRVVLEERKTQMDRKESEGTVYGTKN